ncbi:MAG: SMP-30/gluconolactonase/LRE family protein [Mangrovibacterium sp.]
MKKTFLLFLIILPALAVNGQKLVELWRTGPVMKTPESVLYNPRLGVIFVSNIDGESNKKDGKGFISQLSPDGQIKNQEWVSGLNAPKGMAFSGDKLYVADIDELVEIDSKKAAITNRYPVKDAVFLNDVAAAPDGRIFVSDTRTGKIHMLQDGSISEWLPETNIPNVNGLYVEGNKLYTGSDKLLQIDLNTKAVETIQEGCGGIDGLDKEKGNRFVFSNWAGRIYLFENGKMTKIADSTAEKINTADISFARALNLLLVPTFSDNQVVAYQIE